MRGHTSIAGAARHCRPARRLAPHIQRRAIQITAAPTSETPITGEDPFSNPSESSSTAGRMRSNIRVVLLLTPDRCAL